MQIRFGRLDLLNSYGPETQDLRVLMRAEYFDGQAYVPNTDDAYDNAPRARATFGVYSGSKNMIYRYEVTP